jgi:hypothetical protein
MRTVYGKECRFYYEDYFRGREKKECRLIDSNPDSEQWSVSLCRSCPVPDILSANACPNLMIQARARSNLFGLHKWVDTQTACKKFHLQVEQPQIGCGHCHEELKT